MDFFPSSLLLAYGWISLIWISWYKHLDKNGDVLQESLVHTPPPPAVAVRVLKQCSLRTWILPGNLMLGEGKVWRLLPTWGEIYLSRGDFMHFFFFSREMDSKDRPSNQADKCVAQAGLKLVILLLVPPSANPIVCATTTSHAFLTISHTVLQQRMEHRQWWWIIPHLDQGCLAMHYSCLAKPLLRITKGVVGLTKPPPPPSVEALKETPSAAFHQFLLADRRLIGGPV